MFGNAIFVNNQWILISGGRNATLATLCIKYHEDCMNAGAGCPLYITLNTNYEFFAKVDEGQMVR